MSTSHNKKFKKTQIESVDNNIVKDLKKSFDNSLDETSEIFNNVLEAANTTLQNEKDSKDALSIILTLQDQFKRSSKDAEKKVDINFNRIHNFEEE